MLPGAIVFQYGVGRVKILGRNTAVTHQLWTISDIGKKLISDMPKKKN